MAPASLFHPLWGNLLRNLILFGKLNTRIYFLSPGHHCSHIVTLTFLSTGPAKYLPVPLLQHILNTSVLWFPFHLYLPVILPSFFPGICSHAKKLENTSSQRYLQSLSSFFPCHKPVNKGFDEVSTSLSGVRSDFPGYQHDTRMDLFSSLFIIILPDREDLNVFHFKICLIVWV